MFMAILKVNKKQHNLITLCYLLKEISIASKSFNLAHFLNEINGPKGVNLSVKKSI